MNNRKFSTISVFRNGFASLRVGTDFTPRYPLFAPSALHWSITATHMSVDWKRWGEGAIISKYIHSFIASGICIAIVTHYLNQLNASTEIAAIHFPFSYSAIQLSACHHQYAFTIHAHYVWRPVTKWWKKTTINSNLNYFVIKLIVTNGGKN